MVPQGRQLCGLQPQEPREDSTSTQRPRRVGPLGCRRWERGREGGAMCAETRSEQLRGRAGRRALSDRAHTRARTLYPHTWSSSHGGGAGRRAEASVLK